MNEQKMTRRAARWWSVGVVVVGSLAASGCEQILGIDGTYKLDTTSTGGSGAGGSTTGGTTMTGGSTGGTTTTQECMPGTSEECYDGPDGTKGVGLCAAGMHQCSAEGVWARGGEVLPTDETCVTKTDEDCDGRECALWSVMWPATEGLIVAKAKAGPEGRLGGFGTVSG
ncbi:MAG: hypothetical protein U0441_13390 [Polyangiaceae bacterium]